MKQYIVIGCGRFGTSVATTMHLLGHQVMAIDKCEEVIQNIADKVTHAAIVDVSDEQALRSLGLGNFDVAIIAIGSDIRASIMATLIAKEVGVAKIVCKATDEIQAKVLYKIGADRVVLPEKDMGVRVAHNLVSASILDFIELSPDYSIMELKVLNEWSGKTLKELKLRSSYGINIMAIKKGESINISPKAEDILEDDDIIVAIGSADDLSNLEDILIRKK